MQSNLHLSASWLPGDRFKDLRPLVFAVQRAFHSCMQKLPGVQSSLKYDENPGFFYPAQLAHILATKSQPTGQWDVRLVQPQGEDTMNTRLIATSAAALALTLSPAAYAQMSEGAAGADSSTEAQATGDFSDADIAGYARAMGEIQTIQADTTLDAQTKQNRMASAIQAAGLDVATFNAIATQSQSDPALEGRIRAQMTAGATP